MVSNEPPQKKILARGARTLKPDRRGTLFRRDRIVGAAECFGTTRRGVRRLLAPGPSPSPKTPGREKTFPTKVGDLRAFALRSFGARRVNQFTKVRRNRCYEDAIA